MHSPWANSARRFASSLVGCLLGAACCLLVSGCSNSGRQMQTDLYQRELRLQEDEIYRLEDYIEEYQGIVRGYRCKVEELESQLSARRPESRRNPTAEPVEAEPLPAPALAPSRGVPESRPEAPEPLDIDGMPDIDLPETLSPPADAAPSLEAPGAGGEPPLFKGANATPIGAHDEPIALASAASHTLDTGAADDTPPNAYPHTPGAKPLEPPANTDPSIQLQLSDDGGALVALVTAIEDSLLVDFTGEASVMLTDPSVEGRRRRIARWDFTPDELRVDALEPVLKLPVLLPTDLPEDRPLRVWVRLVDATGVKRLQATTARFRDGRLQADDLANAEPRRLPTATVASSSEADGFPAEQVADTAHADGWRAAGDRRADASVVPASFEADW